MFKFDKILTIRYFEFVKSGKNKVTMIAIWG